MTPAEEITPFLDVHTLIERSQPRARVGWFWYALGVFALIVVGSAYVSAQWPAGVRVVDFLSKLCMVGLMVGLAWMTSLTIKRQREEMKRVEGLGADVQLRRWPEAAATARALLAEP